MKPQLHIEQFDGDLSTQLKSRLVAPASGVVTLYWLGQAGFIVDSVVGRFVIDPYLSDSLAQKYRGTLYPHVRMMPTPIAPEDIAGIDYVLCTHRHTDHMDPGTLQPMAQARPALQFVVPEASLAEAQKRCGVGLDRLLPINSGRTLSLTQGANVHAIASAHEELSTDALGNSEWLGYILEVDGLRIYHSGDCIPYPGLVQQLRALRIDVALLPVNGRDLDRLGNGVPGNFTLEEAIGISVAADIPHLIGHHHGLFDFSTIAPQDIDAQIPVAAQRCLQLIRARTGCSFSLQRADRRCG